VCKGRKSTGDPNFVYIAKITDLKTTLGPPRAPQSSHYVPPRLEVEVVCKGQDGWQVDQGLPT
jgi:hypothetical protein